MSGLIRRLVELLRPSHLDRESVEEMHHHVEMLGEIGIRMAMGADAARLVGWVVGTGARLIAVGLAAGALVAWTARRSLDALLFGVGATDGFTAIIAIVLITLLGLAATVIPSWRAVRIDPVVVLRRG